MLPRRFKLSVRQVKQISLVFDADGTGNIDYDEFVRFCQFKDVASAVAASKAIKKKKKKPSNQVEERQPGSAFVPGGGGGGASKAAPAKGGMSFSPQELEVSRAQTRVFWGCPPLLHSLISRSLWYLSPH